MITLKTPRKTNNAKNVTEEEFNLKQSLRVLNATSSTIKVVMESLTQSVTNATSKSKVLIILF